ncbi:aspartic protease 2, partial [Aphelenchoides avenae]
LEAVKPTQSIVDFMADISIGTPPQWFSVSLIPSLSYTWVADSSCRCPTICNVGLSCLTGFCSKDSECCDADFGNEVAQRAFESDFRSLVTADRTRNGMLPPLNADRGIGDCNPKRVRFNSAKSSTYKKSGISFNDTAGPSGWGFTGLDVISLGSLSVEDAVFGQAVKVWMDSDIDGVQGLAPNAASPNGIDSLVVTAFKKGIIDQPIATFWIANASTQTIGYAPVVGSITYGGEDSDNCGPVPVYHPVSSLSDT